MLKITLIVDAPEGQSVGIKEEAAQYFEQFGDVRVVDVQVIQPEQMKLNGAQK